MSHSPHHYHQRPGLSSPASLGGSSSRSVQLGLAYVLVLSALFFTGFYLTSPDENGTIESGPIRGPNNIHSSGNNIYNSNIAAPNEEKGIRKTSGKGFLSPASLVDPLATKKNFEVIWPSIESEPSSNYPPMQSMLDVVMNWNPDIPDPPSVFTETLQHFNYSDPAER